MSMGKNIGLWFIALALMLLVYTYQKWTGPTYPLKSFYISGGEESKFKLPRSHPGEGNQLVSVPKADGIVSARMQFRKYKSYDDFSNVEMEIENNKFQISLPRLRAAGKYMYKIFLTRDSGEEFSLTDEFVIIRFRDGVPNYILYPHIFFMFFSMWFTFRAGIEALFGVGQEYKLAIIAGTCFLIGGFIFGPIMQKYAFGEYWTGWPLGGDLTDNKTLAAAFAWVVMAIVGLKKSVHRKYFILFAVVVQIGIFLIPHSALGSEHDFRPEQEQSGDFKKANDELNNINYK
jgi:hypothetical protein